MIWAILGAAVAVYSWKLMGYLVPARFFTPRIRQIAEALTVALLAGLVALQGFGSGSEVTVDGRAAGLAVAAGLLFLSAPFLVTIVCAAITSVAAQQLLGWLSL